MLTHLSIRHLAVVEQLELSFQSGMTVLTGETGAGKSILIDALGLTLGERADSQQVRANCTQAEITAIYEIQGLSSVIEWLSEQGLLLEQQTDCIIRRCITPEGRSRAYINGSAVPLNQLRELGERLVNIHSQHQHHALLKSDFQRALLDEYGNHQSLCSSVRKAYQELQTLQKTQKGLLQLQGQQDKLALLQYQIQELEDLNLNPEELPQLEQEHRKLTHAEEWARQSNELLSALYQDATTDSSSKETGNLRSTLHQVVQGVAHLKKDSKNEIPVLDTCYELLSTALIHIDEASNELNQFKESLTPDPERLSLIETRLTQIHDLSRKHRIPTEQLAEHLAHLKMEASQLTEAQHALNEIDTKIEHAEKQYRKLATELTAARQATCPPLEKLIKEKMILLEMPKGQFQIQITPRSDGLSAEGMDIIEFLVSTNPGLPLQPLRKIASGGELSRLSLAIQVITAEKMTTPTLIFDEVDVGISGKTAETVGQLLRQLSRQAQILCVTHLPQVAAQGQHHLKVEKQQTDNMTGTLVRKLTEPDRVQEIARILGGAKITQNTLAHAREMLEARETEAIV